MPNHSGTSCPRCSAQSWTQAHMACSTVNSVCITLPHACMWSISIDRRHGPLSPRRHCPHGSQAWHPLPNWFAVPAIHSAGLGLHRHWVLRLQTPCGSLHFRIRELFSLPRKWHPECFLFSFYFVLKCCQNGFDFKSPGYFGNTEVPRCFWMFMIAAPANLKLNECV